jgi:hypothetical protein
MIGDLVVVLLAIGLASFMLAAADLIDQGLHWTRREIRARWGSHFWDSGRK